MVIQESVFTRRGVDRILRYAFELAQSRPRKTLTSATKSNGLAISMPYWDERVEEMAKNYPKFTGTSSISISCVPASCCSRSVLTWWSAPTCSAIFSPISARPVPALSALRRRPISIGAQFPSLFEPVHGSAPDIYGKNIANPIATVWAGAMMLDFSATAMSATTPLTMAFWRRLSRRSPADRKLRT